MSKQYRHNHYVPEWYQKRFLPADGSQTKLYYLDLHPEIKTAPNGKRYLRNEMQYWGPKGCFAQDDLYTTKFGDFESTEIEQKFFGDIDVKGKSAVEYFSRFQHPHADEEAFISLMRYMSTQKLRTPKGLAYLRAKTRTEDPNELLFRLQEFRDVFCAIWSECVWQLADCDLSDTKLIISDHPVTAYNKSAYPMSVTSRRLGDPEIWLSGTHTYFPLSENRVLILTNLSWVRQPYANALKNRPNPNPFRQAFFNFTQIQTHRQLTEKEVLQINYITKKRASRYIAAQNKHWLYPERFIGEPNWPDFGNSYLLMPDPRSVTYTTQTIVGYEGGGSDVLDEYGRRPDQSGFRDKGVDSDWYSFLAFQGEYARRFGPRRKGRSMEFARLDKEEDSPEHHAYHLGLEKSYSKRKKTKV